MKTTRRAWLLKSELIGSIDNTEKALIHPIVFDEVRTLINGTEMQHATFGMCKAYSSKKAAVAAMHAALSDNGLVARRRHERRRKTTGATA